MTSSANEIIGAYYRKCHADAKRNVGRTTVRLLDCLNRLSEAHARLMVRDQVTGVDAIVAVHLMESSLGFVHITESYDIVKETLLLRPHSEEIKSIIELLGVNVEDTTTETRTTQ